MYEGVLPSAPLCMFQHLCECIRVCASPVGRRVAVGSHVDTCTSVCVHVPEQG